MKRPTWNEQMTKELAQIMGKIIFDWCNGETDLETCIEDSEKILEWNHDEDGYTLAKALEDKRYYPDTMLVDELDIISSEASIIHKNHVKEWVKTNDLNLEIPIGAEVEYKELGKMKSGKIVQLYPETLQYGVRTPDQSETAHYLINAESLSLTLDSTLR